MREFKNSITGKDEEEQALEETKRELTEQSPATTADLADEDAPEGRSEPVEADVVSDGRS